MISDFNIVVTIDELIPGDNTAIINNQNDNGFQVNSNDLGYYFDLLNGQINHSLTNIGIESKFTFTFNSRIEVQFQQDISGSASLNVDGALLENGGESPIIDQMKAFTTTLVGRPIKVTKSFQEGAEEVIYDGFICAKPDTIAVRSGTQFTLVCKTKLAQLLQLGCNTSWEDATQTYGNIFTTLSANKIKFDDLLTALQSGTLIENDTINLIDGTANPMPDTVWAAILPNKMRLEVLQEILLPYSRIIYQNENGDINLQPLFIDDRVDDIYNINAFNNFDGTWIGFNQINMASLIPNRIDVFWGLAIPYDPFGSNINNPNIFASTPKVNSSTNQIEPLDIDGVIDYTKIYSTSTRLYNSGKFVMPIMATLSLDNSLVLNAALLNSIMSLYNSNSFIYSNVYESGDAKLNGMAMLWSQIYMAQNNIKNYNATITYDYKALQGFSSPLGKIVSIYNATDIDYPDMLVMSTSLYFDSTEGCIYNIDTCPLLSVTGAWFSKE